MCLLHLSLTSRTKLEQRKLATTLSFKSTYRSHSSGGNGLERVHIAVLLVQTDYRQFIQIFWLDNRLDTAQISHQIPDEGQWDRSR